MDIAGGGSKILGLSRLNVILGKNGCGKSHLLKEVEATASGMPEIGSVRYISPERGGSLTYEPGIEHSMAASQHWMATARRRNLSENFRQQSTVLFRRLEIMALREIERDQLKPDYVPRTFDAIVDQINTLLDRIIIKRSNDKIFDILVRGSNTPTAPEEISSGETELISLAIEILSFSIECYNNVDNILLIDEPDVHLHPDLQARLARFITAAVKNRSITVILATHSTALLAGLSSHADVNVAFMRRQDTQLRFKRVSDIDRNILPIFGAHPLSNVFNERPILLVEGTDDERIWQQAVRSAASALTVYPCVVDGVAHLHEYEQEVNEIITAVYDDARAFSLRDRDEEPLAIDDLGCVTRMRLACRSAENLMLSDDVLCSTGQNWDRMKAQIVHWTAANSGHRYHLEMKAFVDGGLDRRNFDLKPIRNILVGMMSNKPWEVLVGQGIAKLVGRTIEVKPHSLAEYLGARVCHEILRLQAK